jgi:hypothetical protein
VKGRGKRVGGIGLCIVAVCLLASPIAIADLSVARAKQEESHYMRGLCRHDNQCRHWGVLICKSKSPNRVLCKSYEEEKDRHGKFTCRFRHRWTASDTGPKVHLVGTPKCKDGWAY